MNNEIKRIRVLQVIDKFATRGSPINGATRILLNWFPAFRNTEVDLFLCVLRGKEGCGAFTNIGVKVHDLNRGKFDLLTILDLIKIIKRDKIDLLHCHQYGSSTMGRIAGMLTNTPVLIHEHMVDANLPVYLKLIDKCLAHHTSKGIAISQAVKQAMIDYRSMTEQNIEIVYNTVPAECCRKIPNKVKEAVHQKYHIPEGVDLVGIIGRLDPVKGHDDFLVAASLLLKNNRNVYFLIVGDGEVKENLQQQIQTLGIEQNVMLLGHCEDVLELISLCDVIVSASHSEGLSMALEEAMAQGKAIVATAVGGVPELVIDQQSGILVPAKNPERLAEAIARLIKNKNLQKDLGENAQKRIKEKFLIQHTTRELRRIYQEVLDKGISGSKLLIQI